MPGQRLVVLTGASGVMGRGVLAELSADRSLRVRAFVPDTRRDRAAVAAYGGTDVEICPGDLRDPIAVRHCLTGADVVLHLAAIVSPLADYRPDLAFDVNVNSMRHLIAAVRAENTRREEPVAFVNVGTVAQTGDRNPPIHWGRVGDPIKISMFDHYALSKTMAERMLIDSGLPRWVSVRQTGIMHDGLFLTRDPIMFHTPLAGVLEWVSVADSGRLVRALAGAEVPDHVWGSVFNIGGGEPWRLTNYEFFARAHESLGISDFQGTVKREWFATQNFHGHWFLDSDRLEELFHFRRDTPDEAFARAAARTPWYFHLAGRLPSRIMRDLGMRPLTRRRHGTQRWLRRDPKDKLRWYFGSHAEAQAVGGWDTFEVPDPSRTPTVLNHGYDESRTPSQWTVNDYRDAAAFRGGTFEGAESTPAGGTHRFGTHLELEAHGGGPRQMARWTCSEGHRFTGSPYLVLATGHWCPECTAHPELSATQAKSNPFFDQVWSPLHSRSGDPIAVR